MKKIMKKKTNPHIGSTLDSFLEAENLLEHTQAVALKRVIAYQLLDELTQQHLSQTDLATKMQTSKAAITRLLDPDNTSVTLHTLLKAAHALGKTIHIAIK
jgi:antitoxin HicB